VQVVVTTMLLLLLLLGLAPTAQAHMPTFVNYDSCVFDDEASTQSLAIYTRVPPKAVVRCSFVMNDINEELQLSLSLPISHYTKSVADGLGVSIYTPSPQGWTPQCRAGWNGWHGGDNGNDNVLRVPLNESLSDRVAVFEPWGVGGYVPIIGCSTPIALTGGRYFIDVNNTNNGEARVCIGVGTREAHFRSPTAWIELKWTFSLWRTWEWGLTRGAFAAVVAFAAITNLYIFALFMYGAKPHWFCCWSPGCSLPCSDLEHNDEGGGGGAVQHIDTTISESDSDPDSDLGCSSSSDSDCDNIVYPDQEEYNSNPKDRAESDQVVDAAGFIVMFWINGVAVVWLVVFSINCVDVYRGQTNGPKLIRWDNVWWSPLMYVYTLPVIVVTILYILARYSRLWKGFWSWSRRQNTTAVSSILIADMIIAIMFDLVYPFSYLSVIVCLYCLLEYMKFACNGRRFHPTIPGNGKWNKREGDHNNVKMFRNKKEEIGRIQHKKDIKFNIQKKVTRTPITAHQSLRKGGRRRSSNSSSSSSSAKQGGRRPVLASLKGWTF